MATYEESTAGYLDHYFGNKVGFVRNYLLSGEVRDAVKSLEERDQETLPVSLRREFINGLTAKIEEKIPILRDVTYGHLQEMVDLGQGDWRDINTIKALYQRYGEIRGNDWDLESLFRPQD